MKDKQRIIFKDFSQTYFLKVVFPFNILITSYSSIPLFSILNHMEGENPPNYDSEWTEGDR
jgi:hypothetical protein